MGLDQLMFDQIVYVLNREDGIHINQACRIEQQCDRNNPWQIRRMGNEAGDAPVVGQVKRDLASPKEKPV
jgi:hypothetical protein